MVIIHEMQENAAPYWQRQQQLRRALVSAEDHDETLGEIVESQRCPDCMGDLLVGSSTYHIGPWCGDVPSVLPVIDRAEADRILGFIEEATV